MMFGTQKMIKPYTYLLMSETSWYIGVRVANKVPAFEDVEYMSSSQYIKKRIAAGEVFTKHILGEYETNEKACDAEDTYLCEYWDVPGRVNKALGGKFTYEMDEEVRAKRSVSLKATLASPEARAKKSAAMKGKFNKLCTIDGITIFASQKEAIKAIGTSRKTGVRSPNFRYI